MLGVADPVEQVIVLDQLEHLTTCDIMRCRGLEQVLTRVLFVNFFSCCDDFETWHVDLNIERIIDDSLVLILLHQVHFQRRLEEIIPNHSWHRIVGINPECILIKSQFKLMVLLAQAQTLAKDRLQLVF